MTVKKESTTLGCTVSIKRICNEIAPGPVPDLLIGYTRLRRNLQLPVRPPGAAAPSGLLPDQQVRAEHADRGHVVRLLLDALRGLPGPRHPERHLAAQHRDAAVPDGHARRLVRGGSQRLDDRLHRLRLLGPCGVRPGRGLRRHEQGKGRGQGLLLAPTDPRGSLFQGRVSGDLRSSHAHLLGLVRTPVGDVFQNTTGRRDVVMATRSGSDYLVCDSACVTVPGTA